MASKIYTGLNPDLREIRILQLLPALFRSSPVRCRLSKALVLDPPAYNALSYCWGDANDVVPITVNGQSLSVTRNLFHALRHLRRRSVSVWLWVDAVCIDQSNINERNHQVRLMKYVYSDASRVLVWLGESEDDSDLAMDLIKTWSKSVNDDGEATQGGAGLADFIKATPSPFEPRVWLGARRFFARPYWKRAWVFQEVVFAQRVILMCGWKQVYWEELSRAQMAWVQLFEEQYHTLVDFKAQRLVTLSLFDVVSSTTSRHLLQKYGRREDHITKLLRLTKARLAEDPRDKVYALLGFEEFEALGIEPDYRNSVETVYTDFVTRCLEFECKLHILCLAGTGWQSGDTILDLPTWVADFRGEHFGNLPPWSLDRFHAAEDSMAEFEISDDIRTLKAKGVVYDVVTGQVPHFTRRTAVPGYWLDFSLKQSATHPTGIPRLQAFFRTIIGDDFSGSFGRSNTGRGKDSKAFFDLAAGFLWSLGDYAMQEHKISPRLEHGVGEQTAKTVLQMNDYVLLFSLWSGYFPSSLTKQALLAPFLGDLDSEACPPLQWPECEDMDRGTRCAHVFMRRSVDACAQRTFFVTELGYMGLGPRKAKKGDVICVLLGCNAPLLLRKKDDCYVLVGDCYVYGIMNGEVLQEARNGKAKFEEIVLQ